MPREVLQDGQEPPKCPRAGEGSPGTDRTHPRAEVLKTERKKWCRVLLEGFVQPPTTTLPVCQLLVQSQDFLNRCKVQEAAVQGFWDQSKSLQTGPGFTVWIY